MAATELEIIDLTELTESSEDEDEEESESSDAELYINETSRAQLHNAIATVSEARLRLALRHLIDTIPAVEVALTSQFVTLQRETRDVIPRWETCCNCDEEFDVTQDRTDDECSFHPGSLEVDESSFEDWDEDCHGPMDSAANRRAYPENFLWSCCDENGTGDGCVRGEHEAATSRKRRRLS